MSFDVSLTLGLNNQALNKNFMAQLPSFNKNKSNEKNQMTKTCLFLFFQQKNLVKRQFMTTNIFLKHHNHFMVLNFHPPKPSPSIITSQMFSFYILYHSGQLLEQRDFQAKGNPRGAPVISCLGLRLSYIFLFSFKIFHLSSFFPA